MKASETRVERVTVGGDVYTRRMSSQSSRDGYTSFDNGNFGLNGSTESEAVSTEVQEPLLKIETEDEFMKSFLERKPGAGWNPLSCCPCGSNTYGDEDGGWRSSLWSAMVSSFPALEWLPKYRMRKDGPRDFVLGTTLAFVIAPKAMAHALLAQMPPYVGLYTVLFSTLIYGMMGHSKWLSLTTGALPALLFGEAIAKLGLPTEEENARVAPMLTFYVGLFTWVMFVLRLDRLVVFIPPAVLSAFSTTAAFLIGTSQVKYLLGIHIKADGFFQTWIEVFKHITKINVPTMIWSIVCVGYLLLMKKVIAPKCLKPYNIPDFGALVAVVVSVALIAGLELDEKWGIETAGTTPAGLPVPRLPWTYMTDTAWHGTLAVEGLILGAINFVLVISICKNFAKKSNSVVIVSQELKALASVNTVGAFFGSMVSGGSFSGSAIVASLQAETLMHNFINSFFLILMLLFMTPLIELLPKATLSSIIVAALPTLIDFSKPKQLRKVKLDDFFLWVGTFVLTLSLGVQLGIISGTILSLIVLIRRNTSSEFTELGVLPGTTIYRSLARFPDARRHEGITMYRLDASLSFANFESFEVQLKKALQDALAAFDRRSVRMAATTCARQGTSTADADTDSDEGAGSTQSQAGTGEPSPCADDDSIQVAIDAQSAAASSIHSFHAVSNTTSASAWEERKAQPSYKRPTIILSFEAVNDIDTPAIDMLCEFAAECQKHDVQLFLASFKCHVRQTLYKAHTQFISKNVVVPIDEKDAELKRGEANTSVAVQIEGAVEGGEQREDEQHQQPLEETQVPPSAPPKAAGLPLPLDPSSWFLNLHDAVVRALSLEPECDDNNKASGSGASSEASTPIHATGEQTSLATVDEASASSSLWPIVKDDSKQSQKHRSNSTPMQTTEVTPSGITHSWQYTRTAKSNVKDA